MLETIFKILPIDITKSFLAPVQPSLTGCLHLGWVNAGHSVQWDIINSYVALVTACGGAFNLDLEVGLAEDVEASLGPLVALGSVLVPLQYVSTVAYDVDAQVADRRAIHVVPEDETTAL